MSNDGVEIIVLADDFRLGLPSETHVESEVEAETINPDLLRTAQERYGEDFGYNPKQPRDKSGKWTSGGQGRSSDDPKIEATAESKALAAGIHTQAVKVEPEITARIASIIGDTKPEVYEQGTGKGDLFGYSHRLKAEDAIATKIERVIDEKGYTREEAAADIKDAVRYTVHYPDDSFGPQAQTLVDTLRQENASVVVKNTWPPKLGSAYKGINIQVTRHDGVRFEVQIHTPQSQAVKDRMHKLYEEQRVLPRTSPRWNEIEREMLRMGEEQSVPTGAIEVFELIDASPTQYFVARNSKGEVSSVARWYLPNSIITEVNTGNGWREADLLLDLTEDPSWEPVEGEPEIS